MLDMIKENKLYIIAFVLLGIVLFAVFYYFHDTPETVEYTSQSQAETASSIKESAEKAGVSIDTSQATQAATIIKEIRTTEQIPVYIIQTTGDKVVETVEKSKEQNQADFSVVTYADTDKQDEIVNLEDVQNADSVTLNQYNVQAYKKELNTIDYIPQEKQVGYTHSWKISDSGQYAGVGVSYDIDDKTTYLKLSYSW